MLKVSYALSIEGSGLVLEFQYNSYNQMGRCSCWSRKKLPKMSIPMGARFAIVARFSPRLLNAMVHT